MVRRESGYGGPDVRFDVQVLKPADFLTPIVQATPEQIAKTGRSLHMTVSKTGFANTSVFSDESTILSASATSDGKGKLYTVDTSLHLSSEYGDRASNGFLNQVKVQRIAEELGAINPHKRIDIIDLLHASGIRIDNGKFAFTANLTDWNNEVTERLMQRMQQMRAQGAPGGALHGDFQRFIQSYNWDQPKVDEELNIPDPKIDDQVKPSNNKEITFILRKVPENRARFLDYLSYIPFASQEEVLEGMEFYAESYSDFVTAICRVESELPPSEKVILGSAAVR